MHRDATLAVTKKVVKQADCMSRLTSFKVNRFTFADFFWRLQLKHEFAPYFSQSQIM